MSAAGGGGASGGAGALAMRHAGAGAGLGGGFAGGGAGRRAVGIGPDGHLMLRTTPLTTRWVEYGRRPAGDDFHDDEEDAAELQSLRKRKRPES